MMTPEPAERSQTERPKRKWHHTDDAEREFTHCPYCGVSLTSTRRIQRDDRADQSEETAVHQDLIDSEYSPNQDWLDYPTGWCRLP